MMLNLGDSGHTNKPMRSRNEGMPPIPKSYFHPSLVVENTPADK